MKKFNRNFLATVAGLLTSLGVASIIDWDTFNFQNPAHICKLIVILAPAIGGAISSINPKKKV